MADKQPESDRLDGFLCDTLKLASGSGLVQVFKALLSPLITRLFLPRWLGIAQSFSAIGKTLGAVSALRYETTIVLPQKKQDAFHQLVLSLLLTTITSLSALALVLIFGTQISTLLNAPELAQFIWVAPLLAAVLGYSLAFQEWFARAEDYGVLSGAIIANGLIWNGGTAALGFVGLASAGAMILSQVAGQAAALLRMGLRFIREELPARLKEFKWEKLWSGLRAFKKFPQFNILSKLLDNASLYTPPILLSAFFSPSAAGYYSLSYNVLEVPVMLIGQAVSQVLYQRAPSTVREGKIGSLVESTLHQLMALGAYVFFVLAIIGRELFTFVFGSAWTDAGAFAQILSPWMFLVFLTIPMEKLPAIHGRNENILVFHLVNVALRITALVVGGLRGSMDTALWMLAGSGMLVYLGNLVWVCTLSGMPVRKTIFLLVKNLSICALGLLPVILLKILFGFNGLPQWFVPLQNTLLILTALLAGGVYYFVVFSRDAGLRELITSLAKKRLIKS